MILASALQNVPCATEFGGDSRLFYRCPPLPTKRSTEEHARTLAGAEGFFIEGDAKKFEFRFRFEGHDFQIENDIPDGIVYFAVADKHCPDEVLLRVLRHFEKKVGKKADADPLGVRVKSSSGVSKSSVPGVRVGEAVWCDESGRPERKNTNGVGILLAMVSAGVVIYGVWWRINQVQGNLNGNQVPAPAWFQPPVR